MDVKPYAIIGREAERSKQLRERLAALYDGLSIESIPFIETHPLAFDLPDYQGTTLFLFTSPRAVEMFFQSKKLPNGCLVASIGAATSKALKARGIAPSFTSNIENAKGMAPELLQYIQNNGQAPHIIQPTSNIAGQHLRDYFEARGFEYTLLTTYEVLPSNQLKDKLSRFSHAPEWVMFYSPSGVRAWYEASPFPTNPIAFSIGPSTTKKLRKLGWQAIFESNCPHEDDIIETIKNNYNI